MEWLLIFLLLNNYTTYVILFFRAKILHQYSIVVYVVWSVFFFHCIFFSFSSMFQKRERIFWALSFFILWEQDSSQSKTFFVCCSTSLLDNAPNCSSSSRNYKQTTFNNQCQLFVYKTIQLFFAYLFWLFSFFFCNFQHSFSSRTYSLIANISGDIQL